MNKSPTQENFPLKKSEKLVGLKPRPLTNSKYCYEYKFVVLILIRNIKCIGKVGMRNEIDFLKIAD